MSGLAHAYRIEINGVVHDMEPAIGDIVRFERQYGGSSLPDEPTAEQVAFLLWVMAKRIKVVDCDFDEFLDAITGIPEPADLPKAPTKPRSRKPPR